MVEPFSALTVLSAAPSVLKFAHDAVSFYSKVNELRSPAPSRPLAEAEFLSRFDRSELKKMYIALETARPVASNIATRSFRFYLLIAVTALSIVVICAILLARLRTPSLDVFSLGVATLALGGFLLVWVIPKPVPKSLTIPSSGEIIAKAKSAAESLGLKWQDAKSGVMSSFRASGVSIPERSFLETYYEIEALVRGLECSFLRTNLAEGISAAHGALTGKIFDTAVDIVQTLAKNGRLGISEDRKKILTQEFEQAGLGRMVDPIYVTESFFEMDFDNLARDKVKLRESLALYWYKR
jgi:hypothetical protein